MVGGKGVVGVVYLLVVFLVVRYLVSFIICV